MIRPPGKIFVIRSAPWGPLYPRFLYAGDERDMPFQPTLRTRVMAEVGGQ